MRTFKLLALLIVMTALSGCDLLFNPSDPSTHFNLLLTFHDASGKDLVKGIEFIKWTDQLPEEEIMGGAVSPDLYMMEVLFPDGSPPLVDEYQTLNFQKGTETYNFPTLDRFGNFLYFHIIDERAMEKITYNLTCPYVFGDDAEHEIIAYCKKKLHNNYVCYRILLDGKEIKTIQDSNGGIVAAATVIIE